MSTQRIIKADSMRQSGQKIVFDYEDFHQHCDDQLQKAREQADQQLGEAQKRAIAIEKQAQAEGYQAGYAEGLKKANEEIQKRVDGLAKQAIDRGLKDKLSIVNSLTEAISEARTNWLAHWERISIEFCLLVAEKIIRTEISEQPNIRTEMIRSLLEVVSAEERVIVRVHPEDAEYFQNINLPTSAPSAFHQVVDFHPDPNLKPGDCLVEMEFGVLDGRIETQLQRIQAELSPSIDNEGQ